MSKYSANKYGKLSRWKRRLERNRYLAEIEWQSREGSFGAVVFQLRSRARVFETRALGVLAALLVVVITGLAFYLYRPVLQNENEIERQIHEQTVRLKQRDILDLNERRNSLRDDIARRVAGAFQVLEIDGLADRSPTDVQFGPDGEAVIVGEGVILTRANGERWIERGPEGLSNWLTQIQFGPQGEAVTIGWSGVILTRLAGETEWVRPALNNVSADLNEIRFGLDGNAVIVGEDGTILTRAPGENEWTQHKLDGVSADLQHVRFGPNGEVVISGSSQTLLAGGPNLNEWTKQTITDATDDVSKIQFGPDGEALVLLESDQLYSRAPNEQEWKIVEPDQGSYHVFSDLRIGPNGEGLLVGSSGTIFSRESSKSRWKLVRLKGLSSWLRKVRFGPDGEAVIIGDGGIILTRAPGKTEWKRHQIDGVLFEARDIGFSRSGEALAIWNRGVILVRAPGQIEWARRGWDNANVNPVLIRYGPKGDVLLVADGPVDQIIERTDHFASNIRATQTDAELSNAYAELPVVERRPLEVQLLSVIRAERDRANRDQSRALERISAADLGTLSRRQRLDEFKEHMTGCATNSGSAEQIKACADAYERVIVLSGQKGWWQLLAEVAPPAVLLLFLLATLGGLYRYNLRMAGFYHGRADALELRTAGFNEGELEKIVNSLAADQVDFRPTKTPIDNITQIANSLISKMDLKKGAQV